jgi:hypothetical protein
MFDFNAGDVMSLLLCGIICLAVGWLLEDQTWAG